MNDAFLKCRTNIDRARDLCGLATAIQAQTTPAVDVTDLLRAGVVFAVSALDHFIHEVTRIGMLEIARGRRPGTDAYFKFKVSLQGVSTGMGASNWDWLDAEVRDRHGWLSFQDPEKLADALRLVTDGKVWERIGTKLGLRPEVAKAQLKLIVDRRNKIAHEADMDPTAPGSRWPITLAIAEEAIQFVDDVAAAVLDLLVNP